MMCSCTSIIEAGWPANWTWRPVRTLLNSCKQSFPPCSIQELTHCWRTTFSKIGIPLLTVWEEKKMGSKSNQVSNFCSIMLQYASCSSAVRRATTPLRTVGASDESNMNNASSGFFGFSPNNLSGKGNWLPVVERGFMSKSYEYLNGTSSPDRQFQGDSVSARLTK